MTTWLTARAEVTPDATAVLAGDERLSFAELSKQTRELAARLHAAGVSVGDRVAIRLSGVDFVRALSAIWDLGAQAAPINTRLVPSELEAQLAKLKPSLFLDGSASLAALPHATDVPHDDFDVRRCAVVMFTSGTEGEPKAAMLSFANLWANA